MNKVERKFNSRNAGNLENHAGSAVSTGGVTTSASSSLSSGAGLLPRARSVHFDGAALATPTQGSPDRQSSRQAALKAEDGSIFGQLDDALLWKIFEMLPTEDLVRSSRVSKR